MQVRAGCSPFCHGQQPVLSGIWLNIMKFIYKMWQVPVRHLSIILVDGLCVVGFQLDSSSHAIDQYLLPCLAAAVVCMFPALRVQHVCLLLSLLRPACAAWPFSLDDMV